jgi:hypothetical protein
MKNHYFCKRIASVIFPLLLAFTIAPWDKGLNALAQNLEQKGQNDGIGLRSRTLISPSDRTKALGALAEIPANSRRHVIIQLDSDPTAADRENLARSGIKLLHYIQNRGWYASVSGGVDTSHPLLERVRGTWAIESVDRLDAGLLRGQVPKHAVASDGSYALKVIAFEGTDLESLKRKVESLAGVVDSTSAAFSTLFVRIPSHALQPLSSLDEIELIEPVAPKAQPEMNRARAFLFNLNPDDVQAPAPYALTGAGVEVGVYEDGHAFRHPDYLSRWIQGDVAGGQPFWIDPEDPHASMVAGTIAGDGTAAGNGGRFRGIATGATIVSYSFHADQNGIADEPNRMGDIRSGLMRGIDIANNSWGYNCHDIPYGTYTSQAQVFDRQVLGKDSSGAALGNPTVVVFSAGNERAPYSTDKGNNTGCISKTVAPYPNYGTINQPKTAKNPIVVGAIDSYDRRMTTFSSWGPTTDGRIKPDIVAPGLHQGINDLGVSRASDNDDIRYGRAPNWIGQLYRTTSDKNADMIGPYATTYDDRYTWFGATSAAAAMASGSAALFIQDFRAQNNRDPRPSTVKAHFIHTARDLNDGTTWYNPGPDYASGYGALDIKQAIDQLRSKKWIEGSVNQGEIDSFQVYVPAGQATAKFTLVWDDAPGTPGATTALVNDIDLVVTDAAGVRRFPWTLNPAYPAADAVRTVEDHINNVEIVYVDGNFPGGWWKVQVRGRRVPSGPQWYSLVSQFDLVSISAPTWPDLTVYSVSATVSGMTQEYIGHGQLVTVTATIKNMGTVALLSPSTVSFWVNSYSYSGPNNTGAFVTTRLPLSSCMVGAIDVYFIARCSITTTLPSQLPTGQSGGSPVTAGPWWFSAMADSQEIITEANEDNNWANSRSYFVGPDLTVSAVGAPATVGRLQNFKVSATLMNIGQDTAPASTTSFYISSDTLLDTTVDSLLGTCSVGPIAGAATDACTNLSVHLPSTVVPGTWYIIAKADGPGPIQEAKETNNTSFKSIQVSDLVPVPIAPPPIGIAK